MPTALANIRDKADSKKKDKKVRRTVYLSKFQDWEIEALVKEGLLGDNKSEVIRFLIISALHRLPSLKK